MQNVLPSTCDSKITMPKLELKKNVCPTYNLEYFSIPPQVYQNPDAMGAIRILY